MLQRWLDGTRQLQCNFVQELLSGALGSGLKESGRLYIARPGRMRWDYLEPERKVALIDGQRTSLYVEEDRELVHGRLDGEGELLPALLVGEGRLAGLFDAELLAASRAGVELRLVPLRPGEVVEEVILTLDPGDYAIRSAEVLDPAGNRMRYSFSELRRNRGLPPDVFRFEPPAGTLIFGEH